MSCEFNKTAKYEKEGVNIESIKVSQNCPHYMYDIMY